MKAKSPYPDGYPLVIPCNNDFAKMIVMTVEINGVRTLRDLTGATVKAQCRNRRDLASPLLFNFGVTLMTETPENGAPVLCRITLSVTKDVTRAIKAKTGYWDLMIIQGDQRTFVGGPVIFTQTVTDEQI